MGAVFKREFKAYFSSPLAYIFLGVMWFFAAYFFIEVLKASSTYIEYVFGSLFSISAMIIPLLTMRLLSEDKKLKTDQLLMTAPVSISGVVFGKYFAACLMFLIGISSTVLFIIIMATFTTPNWNIFLGNFLSLFLVGAAFLSIGLFISSMTENQMVSAILTFAILLAISLFDTLADALPTGLAWLGTILTSISFMDRYSDFINGILNVSHILFFVSIIVVFNFLTIRVLEKKRWS
jgi:ABC-2 type transport system permease protein